MLVNNLGDANTHIIIRVIGSGARLRNFLGSSGFFARTGFLAENVHFRRNRSGMQGKGVVLRHLNLTHLLDDRVDCIMDISAQTQGSARFSDSDHVCQRPGRPPQLDTTTRHCDNIGLGRGRLPRHTDNSRDTGLFSSSGK